MTPQEAWAFVPTVWHDACNPSYPFSDFAEKANYPDHLDALVEVEDPWVVGRLGRNHHTRPETKWRLYRHARDNWEALYNLSYNHTTPNDLLVELAKHENAWIRGSAQETLEARRHR